MKALPLLAVTVLLAAGCRSRKPTDAIADDRAVETKILWRLKDDRRFDEVRVRCESGAITLLGRVTSKQAFEDAAGAAFEEAHGRRIDNRLEVKDK